MPMSSAILVISLEDDLNIAPQTDCQFCGLGHYLAYPSPAKLTTSLAVHVSALCPNGRQTGNQFGGPRPQPSTTALTSFLLAKTSKKPKDPLPPTQPGPSRTQPRMYFYHCPNPPLPQAANLPASSQLTPLLSLFLRIQRLGSARKPSRVALVLCHSYRPFYSIYIHLYPSF
jgi:hypothetical protein